MANIGFVIRWNTADHVFKVGESLMHRYSKV